MLLYYLDLLKNKFTRIYFIVFTVITFFNVAIYELLYITIKNKIMTVFFIIIFALLFLSSNIVSNIKDKYVSHFLIAVHSKNIMNKIDNAVEINEIIKWKSNYLSDVLQQSQQTIHYLINLIENIIHAVLKLSFMIWFGFYYNFMIPLMIITLFLVYCNYYFLCHQDVNKIISYDNLHNYMFYAIHKRMGYLIDTFLLNISDSIKKYSIKNTHAFIYLNMFFCCLYMYMQSDNLTIEHKTHVLLYIRNSSFLFTLVQNMINSYNNVLRTESVIDNVINLTNKKKSIVESGRFDLVINKIKYYDIENIYPIKINKTSKVLVYGDSGIGKSTLLKIIKGIHVADIYDHDPYSSEFIMYTSLEHFPITYNSDEFITEDMTIDTSLIEHLKNILKIKETMTSCGEKTRLVLAKIFYQFYIGGYTILLLDECDHGIQDQLLQKIIKNIFDSPWYNNLMIIMVSHNKSLRDANVFDQEIQIDKFGIKKIEIKKA